MKSTTSLFVFILGSVWGNMMPEFIPSQSTLFLNISESPKTKVGSVVHTFKALDWDDDSLSFTLLRNPPHEKLPFKITRESGQTASLLVTKPLDREVKDRYSFTVQVTDGRVKTPSTLSVKIRILDVNDNYPKFINFNSTFKVSENRPVPLVISIFSAVDLDEGPNGHVKYFVHGDLTLFKLLPINNSVQLVLVAPLDYEEATVHNIQIFAQDSPVEGSPLKSSINVTIIVQDENDNPPRFVNQAVIEMKEGIAINSKIFQLQAVDGDSGVNSPVAYKLRGKQEKFFVEPGGAIRTLAMFNLTTDLTRIYRIKVNATELDEKGFHTDADMIIKVVRPSGRPIFRNGSYHGSIPENSPVGTPAKMGEGLLTEVQDYDMDSLDEIKLSLQGRTQSIFDIYPKSGYGSIPWQIIVKDSTQLDFEKGPSPLHFNLVAVDTGGNTSTVAVSIVITDENDNAPRFSQSHYHITIPENPLPGSEIAKVVATDADSGPFGKVRYTHIWGPAQSDLVLNETTGQISTNLHTSLTLDYEIQEEIQMTVEACDNLGTGHCSTVSLTIHLTDENDNSPKFSQSSYEVNIYENQKDITLPISIVAIDSDAVNTNNSLVTYRLLPLGKTEESLHFNLDPPTGIFTLVKPFDFEALNNFFPGSSVNVESPLSILLQFIVEASDSGVPSKSSRVPLSVTVYDENDCDPQFNASQYKVRIMEDAPLNYTLMEVKCHDNDSSPAYSSTIYTLFQKHSNDFVIHPTSGVITLATQGGLDKFQNPSVFIWLYIRCFNILRPDKVSSATVKVLITDVNDKPPKLITNSTGICDYSVAIPENTKPDLEVLRVSSTHPDFHDWLIFSINYTNSRAYKNGKQVDVTIEDNLVFDYQTINSDTGVLRTGDSSFDYEILDKLEVELVVNDTAAEKNIPQIDTAWLCVEILNENDVAPKFTQKLYIARVRENTPVETAILTVAALWDEDFKLTYSLYQDFHPVPFHIDPDLGIIRVHGSIDREMNESYMFLVSASTSWKMSNSVHVYLQIEDENDNKPTFTVLQEEVQVLENTAVGSVITTVQASDIDLGKYGQVNYLLEGDSGTFQIDYVTGSVSVLQPLDRDVQDRFFLTVVAVDNDPRDGCGNRSESLSTRKNMSIRVIDVNDHSPQFHFNEEKEVYTVWENATVNDIIVSFFLTDDDEPGTPNSQVTAKILNAEFNPNMFQLKKEKREEKPWWSLRPAKSFIDLAGYYTIVLESRDKGYPPHWVSVSVTICIKSPNPMPDLVRFGRPSFTAVVTPGYPLGTDLTQLELVDYREKVDASWISTGRVEFSLQSQSLFSIHPTTGVLSVTEPVSHEPFPDNYYNLMVTVSWIANSNNHRIPCETIPIVIYKVGKDHKFVQRTGLSLHGDTPWSVARQLQSKLEYAFGHTVNVEPNIVHRTNNSKYGQVQLSVCMISTEYKFNILTSNQVRALLAQENVREIRDTFKFLDGFQTYDKSDGTSTYWLSVEEIQMFYLLSAMVIIISCLILNTLLGFALNLLGCDNRVKGPPKLDLVCFEELPRKLRDKYTVNLHEGKLKNPTESDC